MDKKDVINDLSATVAGTAVETGIAAVVPGIGGVLGGAAIGSVVGKVFEYAGKEILNRFLSKREEHRITNVMDLAKKKIDENIKNNKKLREDDFFENVDNRSSAEEILEGTLMVAQKEYEERKLPYMANLYANIAFDDTITREIADRLIKISSDLTYRQLMILSAIGFAQISGIHGKTETYRSVSDLNNVSIASEIFDLYRKSLVFSSEVILDTAGINPSKLTLGGYGALLYNLMELPKFPLPDKCVIDIYLFLGILQSK